MSGGTPLGNMVIKLGLDDADFGKGVENSKKQVKYLAKEMQANMRIADLAGNQLGKLGTRYDGLTKIIGAQEKQVESLKKAYAESFVEGKATDSTKRLAADLQDANGKLANYKQQLINTAGAMAEYKVRNEGFTGAINKASDSLIKNGQTMENYGGKLTKGITLPLVSGAAAVTTAAISWESAFAGVKKTVDEVVDSNGRVTYSYKDLENGLRGLSKELPSSHKEIAAVAEAAGQLGIETPNVVSFTKTMIDLGESTSMSAETAATELARFANITGMSQDKFSNLGSALVDLGNNFATTEGEISAMSLRLAGAGSQIGMTEGEILGFAAALSSVGVESEAGGSAFSKVMIQMQLAAEKGMGAFDELINLGNQSGVSFDQMSYAVQKGGNTLKATAGQMGLTNKQLSSMYKEADKSAVSLQNFAEVAGMTNAEFGNMFKQDPSKAIMKFVEGLANAESQGKSAIAVLDDMDITEVRLRDSLLRAANASGVFSDAVTMGNKAFKENTALAEEAGKRYETTESKLKMLKNEAVDAAIDLGGPFVDALRDGLESSKPLIKGLGDLATKFSELDPKTQRMIVGLVGGAAAAGPLLSITGKLSSGIGGLGKAFVDLRAKSVKKKAIAEMTKQLATGAVEVGAFSTALGGGATKLGLFGGAANTASGAAGVGAMTTSLGALSPVLLGIVGAGGVLALGYGAWKLWGEEAWNASQRTKRWGEDVGSATDTALQKVQTSTQQAAGEFNLMTQGFEGNTQSMVSNFQQIGQTIENDLTSKLEAYKQAVDLLPTELQEKANEVLNGYQEETSKTLKLIQSNNEEALNIKKTYIDKDGEVTIQGAKMIQDLMKQSTAEYLKITIDDADARKEVMTALTGNVESATEKQAEAWIQSLAKQRQATKANYTEQINDYRKKLEDTGQLNQKEIDMLVGLYEEARETSTDALDAQMALLVKKYPELAEKISLANGQLAKEMGNMGTGVKEANQDILDNAANLADKLSKNAQKNADVLKWTADQGTNAGKTWNSLELLDKEGKVKTNASEIINEASKDTQKWNHIRMVLHEANIDSNAKKMIGEAAIANGWWDGMAWEDKVAVLQDEFSINMYKALDSSGKWDKMSFEQKKAIIYSNTPEVMAETMLNLGMWKDYQPEIKELKAKNYEFLTVLSQSKGKLDNWNNTPDSVKKFQGENYDLLNKIYSSDENFKRWKNIPDDTKVMFAENSDLLEKLATSDEMLKMWNEKPTEEKKLLASNSELMEKILSSSEALTSWNSLDPQIKHFIANNENLLTKIEQGTLSQEKFDNNLPAIKMLLGDASNIIHQSTEGEKFLNFYKNNNPSQKFLNGNASGVVGASNAGVSAINTFNGKYPLPKTMVGVDAASGPANDATGAVSAFNSFDNVITKTLKVVKSFVGLEDGTNFHKGGHAVVNDQKGPLYKELVQYPTGETFIPEGRNVLLDLPRGSKVYKASRTKSIMNRMGVPRYAQGVGVPKNSTLVKDLESVSNKQDNNLSSNINVSVDNNSEQLDELIYVVKKLSSDLKNMKIVMKEREVGSILTNVQNQSEKLKMRLAGERV